MQRYVLLCVVNVAWVVLAAAASIRGTLRYAGLPTAQALPEFTHGKVALKISQGSWIYANLDIATSSWSASGLAAGTYQLQAALSRGPIDFPGLRAGFAYGDKMNISLAEGEDKTLELDLLYGVHVTLPFDNAGSWPGKTSACPYGPAVPLTFTLAWEAVPRAVRYLASALRFSCTGWLDTTRVNTTQTSANFTQRTVPGEEFLNLRIEAFDEQGRQLAVMPYVRYGTSSSTGHYVHAEPGEGRPVHQSSSLFLAQVAHVAGAQGSFWTSDLFLTNRTMTPVMATLYFTPRGADGTAQYRQASLEIPGSASRSVTDVVHTLFGTTGAGSLEISGGGLVAASRCATPAPGGGSYGQGFLPIAANAVAWRAGNVEKLGAGGVAKGSSRSNLAIVEVWGEPVSVMVRLFDRDGVELGHDQLDLLPLSNVQLNDVVGVLHGPATLLEGYVTVEPVSGDGRVGAVLSVVDNGTNDPATVPLLPW